MFIGYPKSGHSLIGSLLDAHPDMLIAHELGTLKYIYAGFSKRQIYYLLFENSRSFTEAGRIWGAYSYAVPNQWQGRLRELRIIGDKHGEGAVLRMRVRPWLLQRLRKTFGIDMKFIHVIRNPYDTISTLSRRRFALDLRKGMKYFFSLCETVADIKKQINSAHIFELKQESFIDSPTTCLKGLCYYLGADASDGYLRDCASIVFKSPHKSRYDVQWSHKLIDIVKRRMKSFPFLDGYSYDD